MKTTLISFVFFSLFLFSCNENENKIIKLQNRADLEESKSACFRSAYSSKNNADRALLKIISILEKGGKIHKSDTSALWVDYRFNKNLSTKNFNKGCEIQKKIASL